MHSSFGFTSPSCSICQQNLKFPSHRRPKCPHHHSHTEIHHHHHYTPPTAPPAPGNYYPPPPAPGIYYPPGTYSPTPPPPYPWPGQETAKSYHWVQSSVGYPLPPSAVRGGSDIDGQPIYVGRANHERDLIPAKIIPGRNCCYISYNGKEYAKSTFQVLCDARAQWVPGHGGSVHPDAVEGGKTETGEKLYIGRVHHKNSHTVGKIHPSHRNCYIPFDGKEIAYPNYEVLISMRY